MTAEAFFTLDAAPARIGTDAPTAAMLSIHSDTDSIPAGLWHSTDLPVAFYVR